VSLEIMHKAPNKYSMSFNMGPMTLQKQTFDGTKGKQSGMQGKKDITGEELEDLKSEAIMNKEMQYEKLGYKLNLKGIEPVNNSEAYILEVVSPSGKKSTEWYDLATGYKVRSSSVSTAEGQTMNTVTDYSDYKDYNGIKYPASVSITGTPMPLKLQLESVEVNKGLKDTEFSAE
jgi:hypothetical protein